MTTTSELIVTFPGGARMDASYKGHVMSTDQPPEDGGQDSAPEPLSLMLASLGTCAGAYVLHFCRSRNIATEGLVIRQTIQPGTGEAPIDSISLTIELPPDFPPKYHNAVRRSAEQCTVKRMLQHPPHISLDTKSAE